MKNVNVSVLDSACTPTESPITPHYEIPEIDRAYIDRPRHRQYVIDLYPTGCPCGCGYRDPCVLTTPPPAPAADPCTGRCRDDNGLDALLRWSALYGVCPCNVREAS